MLLAAAGVRTITSLMPEYSIPHEAVISLNWPVMWFAVVLTVLTGIVFGLAPALQISAKTQAEALKGTGRGGGAGVKHRRLHDALVVFEVALSLVLLTGAGLALKGLLVLQQKPLGYDPKNVLTLEVPLGEANYIQYGARRNFFESIINDVNALPGVEAASISEDGTPPWNGLPTRMMPDNRPATESVLGRFNIVSDRYFASVRQPLLRGRTLTHTDILQASPVAVVTLDFAARYFRDINPIGHHVRIDLFEQPVPAALLKAPGLVNSFQIVGIVASARNRGVDDAPMPAVFVPYTVMLSPGFFLLARTQSDPMTIANEVRKIVTNLDPHQAITQVHSLEYWLRSAIAYPRFATFLFGAFGAVGLLLAAAGVFSVVSYGVAQRTREFGIRMALGANAGDVLGLVLAGVGRVFAIGLLAGLVLSIFAAHQLSGRMEGMGNADASLFIAVPAVLIAATLTACLIPARAATSVPPMDALRHE